MKFQFRSIFLFISSIQNRCNQRNQLNQRDFMKSKKIELWFDITAQRNLNMCHQMAKRVIKSSKTFSNKPCYNFRLIASNEISWIIWISWKLWFDSTADNNSNTYQQMDYFQFQVSKTILSTQFHYYTRCKQRDDLN
jgi:hypothetical protein